MHTQATCEPQNIVFIVVLFLVCLFLACTTLMKDVFFFFLWGCTNSPGNYVRLSCVLEFKPLYLAHCEERPLENQRSAGWITLDFQTESLLLTVHLPLIILGWKTEKYSELMFLRQSSLKAWLWNVIVSLFSITVFIYLINNYSCWHYIFNYIVLAEPR